MFYRLCSGAPQQLKSKLGITKAEDFLVSLHYRLFAEVTVFTSLLLSNTIFYQPIWELFLPKTRFEASQAVFWSLSGC